MALRPRASLVSSFAALVALAACSTDSMVAPGPEVEVQALSGDYERTIGLLAASSEFSQLRSPVTQHLVGELERIMRGGSRTLAGSGPSLAPPPVDPSFSPAQVASLLFNVTILLYQNRFFADATGDLRLDRAISIIHPIHYAATGIAANDSDQAIAGFEATIEWYEQRNAEGLIPNDIAQWIIDYANLGIGKLGGSNTTVTMCLSSQQRSCVTASLRSIRWHLPTLKTRLAHDFSYAFLDGDPARIDVSFRIATGAPNCNIVGSPIVTSTDVIGTVLVRQEPTLTANPNQGGMTTFACVPYGVIRGFRWDGFVVRDAGGAILASCGKSSGNPCFEPAS